MPGPLPAPAAGREPRAALSIQLCGPSAGGDAEERWRLCTQRGPACSTLLAETSGLWARHVPLNLP